MSSEMVESLASGASEAFSREPDGERTRETTDHYLFFLLLIGPFLMLMTLTAILVKVTPYWYLPISVLILFGLVLQKNQIALVASLFFTAAAFLYTYPQLSVQDRFWHVALLAALSLSFLVFVLSMEEGKKIIRGIFSDSDKRLSYFLEAQELIKQEQEKNDQIQQELQVYRDGENLHKESIQKIVLEYEKKLIEQAFNYEERQRLHHEDFKRLESEIQTKLTEQAVDFEEQRKQLLNELRTQEEIFKKELIAQKQALIETCEKEKIEEKNKILSMEKEKKTKERTLEQIHSQLKEQFEAKSEELHLARKMLFDAEERVLLLEAQKKEDMQKIFALEWQCEQKIAVARNQASQLHERYRKELMQFYQHCAHSLKLAQEIKK